MPIVRIENVGSRGIIQDVPPHELPVEAWSDGINVRFRNNKVQKFPGESAVMGTPLVAPHWLLPWNDTAGYKWIYASTAKVYHTDGTTHTDITRTSGDYTPGARPLWSGGVLTGIPILNHDALTDYPQAYDSGTSKLVDLPNWPANTYCKIIRPFGSFLVALDVTKSGTRDPYMVKWSHQADPGAVPSSWDETDDTLQAGENSLIQTHGYILDGLTLGTTFVIYKEDAIWGMQFIGGPFVFRFYEVTQTVGILAPRCVKEFYRNHFVVATDDIFIFDGNRPRSIIGKRMRDWFFSALSQSYYRYTFVTPNLARREMWVCFVEEGQTYANKALIWNWEDDTWTVRDIPNLTHMGFGQVNTGSSDSFDASAGVTFDNDSGTFGDAAIAPANLRLLGGTTTPQLLHLDDSSYTDSSSAAYTSYVERTGLTVVSPGSVDPSVVKFVRRVYPKVEWMGTPPTLNVYVGFQDSPSDPVTWTGPLAYDPSTDYHVDCRVRGRYIAVRFEDTGSANWTLSGYELDLDVVGRR